METILINIDSKYRDLIKYPNESNFNFLLDKLYKNVISIKMASFELDNTFIKYINDNYFNSINNNNYFKLYLPNKLNDPEGIKIILDNNLSNINSILNNITSKLNNIDNYEKYFYFFYLNKEIIIEFDFNLSLNILSKRLTLNIGWYSVYGLINIINNYIVNKYNELKEYKIKNPNMTHINLTNNNFILSSFNLNIYDKRFNNNNYIRIDTIPSITCTNNNLLLNMNYLKNIIYNLYLDDIITFNITNFGSGILDKLVSGTYVYNSNIYSNINSKYYITNNNTSINNNLLLFNFNAILDQSNVLIKNSYENYYFYINNTFIPINNFLSKTYLYTNNYITLQDFNNSNFIPSLNKDIATFEIDFNINNFTTSIGYCLGFKDPNLTTSIINQNYNYIKSQYIYNIKPINYILLYINNWGYINFDNKYLLSKIVFNTNNNNNNILHINNEFMYRQPMNIQKLEIQIIDYLGNQINLNGIDYSFTLELKQIINTNDKNIYEKNNNNVFNYNNKLL